MSGRYEPTARTTVRRLAKRAVYDRDAVHAILDEAFVCHVGFVSEGGPAVIPTAFGRDGETVYLHGSAGSHMLRSAAAGAELCISVTLVDGLVMARSVFHHSINYRSVAIFGRGRAVTDPEEKMRALRTISEHIAPGRWDEVRAPDEKEMRATAVVAVSLAEVSAKVRTGPPVDDEEDYALPVWAGVLPLRMQAGDPVADPKLADGIEPSAAVRGFRRAG